MNPTTEPNSASLSSEQKPSRTRYWVVVFAVTLAVIQYIDRVCISKSKSDIQQDLHLSDPEMGWVLGAFGLAYALFEIPSGWMGDRYGPRQALIRVVLWWSFFTFATGWTGGFMSLVIVRFLFGAGEAGCFPNLTRAFVTWLLPAERVRAQSILWLSARWGGAVTPLLVMVVLNYLKGHGFAQAWRQSFYIFGALGIAWVILFAWWFRDNPKDHPGVNAAEKKLLEPNSRYAAGHGKVPWGLFIKSKAAWLLWAQYFCVSYVWYFYVTWLSDYLRRQYMPEYDDAYLTQIACYPLFFGGIGCMVSGFVTKHLASVLGLRRARRMLAAGGLLGTTVTLACVAMSDLKTLTPGALGMLFGAASMFSDFTMPCSWGACMDVGGRFAGTFSGSMNMMGNFAAFLCPVVIGYASKDWNFVFWTMTVSALLGAICWLFIDPVTRIDGADVEEHEGAEAVPIEEP